MVNLPLNKMPSIYALDANEAADIASLLQGQPYQFSGFETIESLKQGIQNSRPDVLIVDYDFIQSNQLSLSALSTEGLAIIGVSTHTDIKQRLLAIRQGCSQCLSKPLDRSALLASIADMIQSVNADSYRVLVVDDDTVTMEYHSILLEQQGIEVRRLSEPMQCLDVMDAFKPDLVLLDVEMPEINGVELSQVIRQIDKYTYVPIIFLSSESNAERQQEALKFGGEFFIVKPVVPEHFMAAIGSRLKYARHSNKLHQALNKAHLLGEQQRLTIDQHAIVSITDVNGDIIYINDKFCEISGYLEHELIGQNHRLLKSGMHPQSFYDDIWHVISGGNIWHGVICNHNKQGEEYWVDSTIVPFMDEQGLPYQYVSVRTDITRIRINEQRLSLSQKVAGIGTWDWNLETDTVLWSEIAASLFGYKDGAVEYTYEAFDKAIHPDDKDYVEESIRACIDDATGYDLEHRVIWPDGSVHWLHESGTVIKNSQGKALHMLGVVRDITLRKSIMEQLSYSEQLMRSQLDSMSEGMFGLDQQGRATFVNQAACAILGYDQQEVLGQRVSDLILPVAAEFKADNDFLLTEENRLTETDFKCVDGDVIAVEYAGMPIRHGSEVSGTVITFKDITERKRVEAELINAKEQAEKANKAKTRFLASMSHELRTPLNAIIGFGQLLQMELSLSQDDMQKDNIAELLRAARHLLELINEVLDLSKIEAGQTQVLIEQVLLAEIIDECIQMISPLAEENEIDIVVYEAGKLLHDMGSAVMDFVILADKRRLKQVILNLLSNAVKYNSLKGSITISYALVSDESCRLEISDTGKGLSEEHLKDLFKPFTRFGFEDSEVEGTGIGLVITKNLIEMMGGGISCRSQLGEGTTFTVELNTLNEDYIESIRETDKTDDTLENKDGHYNILYIEDNPANIRLMAQVFSRQKNLHLSTAMEPLLGLDLLAKRKPDLVLLDINLPGMSGFSVLEEIHKMFGKDYPVIAITANSLPADREKGIKAGFNEYITKPINVKLLLDSVRQLLKI